MTNTCILKFRQDYLFTKYCILDCILIAEIPNSWYFRQYAAVSSLLCINGERAIYILQMFFLYIFNG